MATLAPGAQFGEYLIERELARGGMGVVYKATRIRTGQAIALKCIAPERAAEPSYRDRFVREANVLVGLQHPRIVPLIDWGDVDGVLYLALAYLDGPDLEVLIERDGPFSLGRTIELLAPIAEALDAAHRRGYIHRDVKPANIMLDADGNVYLTDFGLGKLAGSSGLSATNTAIGTLAYMSPEQFTGKLADPSLASRTDIYALGCVFHACLTRQETVPTDNFVRAMHAVLTEPPPRLSAVRPSLPAALDEVEARALAKDPAERYERATAFIAAARAVLAAHPDPEPAAQVLLPPPPGARRDLPPDPGPPAMTEVAPAVAATVVASHAGAGPPAGATEAATGATPDVATIVAPPGAATVVAPPIGPTVVAPPPAPGVPTPPVWGAGVPRSTPSAGGSGINVKLMAMAGAGIAAVLLLGGIFALASAPREGPPVVAGASLSPAPTVTRAAGPTPTTRPTPTATASTGPTPTASPTPTPTATPPPVPGAPEDPAPVAGTWPTNPARVRRWIPAEIRNSCTRERGSEYGEKTEWYCSTNGLANFSGKGIFVTYLFFATEAAARRGYETILTNAEDGYGSGGCPKLGSEGQWWYTRNENRKVGRLHCALVRRQAQIQQTYYRKPILAIVYRSGKMSVIWRAWRQNVGGLAPDTGRSRPRR